MNTGFDGARKPDDRNHDSMRQRSDLGELKDVIARGDYHVPATEIAKRMLSSRVFQYRKYG